VARSSIGQIKWLIIRHVHRSHTLHEGWVSAGPDEIQVRNIKKIDDYWPKKLNRSSLSKTINHSFEEEKSEEG